MWIFPLGFASGVFVPVETMPGWLQGFAKANPITIFVHALRGLTGGGPIATPLMQSLVWIAAIVLVFGPWPSASTARSPDPNPARPRRD